MRNIFGNFKKNLTPTLLRLFATALLFATIMAQIPVPGARAAGTDLTLTKTIEGGATTAQVGDIIRYRIHFACSNLTTPCGPMEITDVLDSGVTYVPAQSSVPSGFTMVELPTGTITITKDDSMLLDGSQYDAVIAVQVKYDLRPLPTTVNNTVNGRIAPTGPGNWENTTPASAPPITIGVANPYWAIAKTLSSPIINPTIDTDVTYQVQLCPTTPPAGQGNVALTNIVITDTLPTGAAFVSASNGGTFLSGVVTWPAIAGPVNPTTCVTRFVTIRYNSPAGSPPGPFLVGFDNDPDLDNNVTNTVNFNANYTPSTGTCTSPCTSGGGSSSHPIDPISEVPSYSKSDTGDPVGFTGTGRFVLSLNTNNTNYPSNSLMLIDNLPPELQVTSVTSGAWASTFDYVRAFVEYSTNNGSSYTAFPGQPIIYNTDATYVAPVANITNVRWRFEYDPDKTAPFAGFVPGLPYTWGFTTSPQIRVTPRAAPINTDPPTVVSLPVAVAGNTYTNCLQVSRIDSTATPILDACDDEPMTVQGDMVSLRASKNETPGAPWDDLDDPTILTFTPDTKILPGDTVRYTITLELTERSSEDLVNPTIQDTLPGDTASPVGPDFVFARNGTATLDGGAVVQPTFSQVGQVLKWEWPSLTVTPSPLGSHFLTVEFYGYVPRGQDPGTYTNNLYAVTDSNAVVCEIGSQPQDSGDVDTDGNTTEFACQNPDNYVVERSAALRGEKWIRSISPDNSEVVLASSFLPDASCPDGGTIGLTDIPTNPFTRFPCISQAFPEGALSPNQYAPPPTDADIDDFEYNLRVFNDGNVPMLKYVLYDILPRVGDTGSGGVLSTAARQSEFRPAMTGPVQFIQGPGSLAAADFTIEYNMTTNPCRPEVFDQPIGATVPGGCDNTWVPAAGVTDWTLVRSYRIRLNNNGSASTPSIANAVPAGSELRFGVPMHILADAPPVGFDVDDALSHEIAWNSFSHVGSYDKNTIPPISIEDLLASEPRKVGITVPERMSVGNRVWRDADNSGTINAPDDTTPGIANVLVNLYRDTDNNGAPDGPAIGSTTTDTEGYYLFSNIPYDSGDMDNNRYIIGIPAGNFDLVGDPLYQLRSSTGTPATVTYTTPTSNVVDSADDGIDPGTPGQEVLSWAFILQPGTEPIAEPDLSNNARDGLAGQRRGVNAERDNNSDLTLDFGFFGGSDVPFSIGNHVWKDDGQTGAGFNYAFRNDGIRQTNEPPVFGALVRLYRDGNANNIPEAAEMIRTDLTDINGFYLFDNLDPGPYFVEIAASNFATGQPLAGWYNSQPTGTEILGVNGGATTADIDNDDNGINNNFPELNGIFSGVVVLTRGVPEPLGEAYLSGEADPGPPTNDDFNPTGWDGPLPDSRGRFGETDGTSNLTIDFGFIPPMSLGNRVWIDEGAGTTPFRAGYNNALQDGTEAGVSGVTVQLWRDTSAPFGTLQVAPGPGQDTLMYTTTTDATGYYLFERLQPASNYFVHIPAANFTGAGSLVNYLSSTDTAAPADDFIDRNDNGFDSGTPSTTGITSPQITMSYNGEPLTSPTPGFTETDINISGAYGPLNVGNYGQEDGDSNLTMDFGFVRPPRSLGNYLWIDSNNNRQVDGGEGPVPTGVRVSLYLDANTNGIPDDFNGDTLFDGNDAIAFDLTDANGYYLFDKLPPGRYLVGVDYTNFAAAGLLEGYASSKGFVDNLINNTDSRDNGVDRLQMGNPALSPHGILSTNINLTTTPVNAPTGETGSGDTSTTAGFNPTAGDGPFSRGRFGETDVNSDLTIDFGFFIPMSIGNRVFIDDGVGGGTHNNGIMDGAEVGVNNVRVELWRDANTDGIPDVGGFVDFDTTAAGGPGNGNGYYLFDDLAPGSYVILIAGSNFSGVGALVGYNSSTPTGTENVGVPLNPYTPNTDRDDNGINNGRPTTLPAATPGILSGTLTLAYTTEATGETELSGQTDPGSPANLAFSPTGWDGPLSRGRWEERDNNSNLTIDFGFIPVYSLGNRVFFDTNNNNTRAGAEVGVNNVRVRLYDSTGLVEILVGADGILNTADDGPNGMLTATISGNAGYYLFNNLPAGDYVVVIPASNFVAGQPLFRTWSSGTTINSAGVISETTAPDPDFDVPPGPPDNDVDSDDNGTRVTSGPFTGDIVSLPVTLGPGAPEPTNDNDPAVNPQTGEQPNTQSNRAVDFGFYTITLGNQVWLDNGLATSNDGLLNGGELGIVGVTVELWSQDLSTLLATTTTGGGGAYTFPGLPASNTSPTGNYVVRLPASNFIGVGVLRNYRSSTGAVPPSTYEPAPNPDDTTVDSDDNGAETGGILGAGGYIQTSDSIPPLAVHFALTPALEQAVNNGTGLTTENRVDFGLTELVALGNRVWFDTGAGAFYNNGILDAGEITVDNVTVQLYTSAGVEVPVGPDGILGTGDDALGGVQTSGGGYYSFDRLYPGTYYVQIPATEFQLGGDLFGYVSSLGAGINGTSDNDVDENGIDVATLTTTGIRTRDYVLLPNNERMLEDQSNYAGTLDDNNVNFTADFGFTQLVAIGNRVWIDDGASGTGVANDGIQNGSEAGMDGVTVELYTSANVLVATTTTATVLGQPGTYEFTNLNPGDYYVHIPAIEFQAGQTLDDYVSSTGNGADETSDHNVDENGIDAPSLATTGISTQVFTLSIAGETTADDETTYTGYLSDENVNFTADFGFLQKVAIGNVVWLDNGAGGGVANDGIQNGTEPGIPNVDLELYYVDDVPGTDTPVATTSTVANGYYFFDDLLPGNYFIFIPAAEFQPTGTLANSPSSTGNGADETTDQSGDENGIDDIAAATNGIYSTPYTLQPNTEQTGEPQPNYTGALDDNNVNFTADFGFTELVALGNRVWFDTGAGAFYNNGILDAGEITVNNVTIQLYTSAGVEVPVGSDGIFGTLDDGLGGVQTSGGGYYRFDRLYPGTYYVHIPAAEFQPGGDLFGYVSSLGAGANETSDNDADENGIDVATLTTTGIRTQNYVLSPNTERTGEDQTNYAGTLDDDNVNFTADFGFVQLVAIGNRVWFDTGTGGGTPDDGIQNGGELGAANVDVQLYRVGDTPGVTVPVATTTTNGSGNYEFSNLNPGDYFVHIPASEFQTGQPLEDYVSSTGNGANETSDQDADENGIDAINLPVNGISSTPYSLAPDSETTTDDETGYGGYLDDDNVNFTADFGFLQKVAIGNVVWLDNGQGGGVANNGIKDGTEPGVPGVDLELYYVGNTPGTDTPVATTSTVANGYYVFDELLPGDYFIFIPAAEFQAAGTLASTISSLGNGADETTDETGDENGIDDATPAVNGIRSTNYTLQPNSERTGELQPNYTGALDDDNVNFTADFGFVQNYVLGNRVWFDINNNGLIDDAPGVNPTDEVGAAGVTVELYAADGLGNPTGAALQSVVTAANGYYLFDGLYAGDYVVVLPASNFTGAGALTGYWSSSTSIDNAGAISEIPAPDADNDTDSDDNGTLQTAPGPFNGAVIAQNVILGPSGDTEPINETDLQPIVGQGSQPDGRANMTVDFGFYTLTLGNLVWSDSDKNGAFNGGEPGINGVTVELWSADGTTQLATTTTAGGGLYSFPGLSQGSYTVRVVAPVGTVSSVDTFNSTDTTNPTTNSDNNDNGVGTGSGTIVSNTVTLTPGNPQISNTVDYPTGSTANPSMDFGFTPVFSLGNRVWFDTNNNSLIDGAETGINGVTVNLYAAGDLTTILATQVTANSGYYLFNGLQAGDYVVSVAASNFGGPLIGYWSSATSRAANGSITETTAALANSDTDSDDNGTRQTSGALNGAVISSAVTLGPATTTEPINETDLDATLPGNQQGQPDTQANMTVDFGFYTITLGDLVWEDLDNSGLVDAPDGATPGYDNVTVELWSSDGSTLLDTIDTSGGGFYTFSGLPTGDYIVRLPAINFNPSGILRDYRSSTGPLPTIAYEPAPDADADTTDSDDNGTETNGLLGLNGYIQSLPVTLTPAAEESFDDNTGTTLETRVDFGVNKSPQIDLTVTKTDGQVFYIAGGTLTYTVVVTNKGPADAIGMTVSDARPAQISSWTWTCDSALDLSTIPPTSVPPATYGCTDDASNPATFTDSLDLPQRASVTYTVVAQIDPAATGTLTNSVTVTPPTGMTDMNPPDNVANDVDQPASLEVTKDDGVQIVAPGATLTYAIIVTNTGAADLTGILLTDTIPTGVTFVSATSGGTFASGQVTWPLFNLASGASTQRDVTVQVADAATLAAGNITSLTNTVHVEDDGSNTGGDPAEDDDDDVDQIANSNVKTLVSSNQAGSANPNVLIGEILTYSIRIDIPTGTINNLQALDVLEHGLAFVGCDATTPISSGNLVLAQNPCATPTPPALTVQAEPVTDTDPNSDDAGRRVTFNFGQVQNLGTSIESLIVTYQVVVLEIDDNVDGLTGLNNVATWTWEGGSLSGSAPGVDIVEPDLSIDKTVEPVVAALGSIVKFSIFIEHTKTSTAPAYDVLVIDELPARLRLDETSVRVRGTSGLPAPTITTTRTSLNVFWTSFPVGDSATITFNAVFVGPSPAVNEASVQWASIPIDPNPILQPQSPYNRHSTERRYDPADPTNNIYRRVSSISIETPVLPETGFAPGVRTILPVQPLDKLYQDLGDMWLEIPALKLKMPIVGIPATADGWDLTWLANQAGYLEGTTFPSQVGTTGITGHVYLADGTPGPFLNLGKLAYGNQVTLHANGQRYIYEVRTSRVVLPRDLSVFKNDGYTWMTLITCKEYIPSLKKYDYRLAVRAVLLKVEAESVSK